MNFFKPEDFKNPLLHKIINWSTAWQEIADIANAKIETEGMIVYGMGNNGDTWKANPLYIDGKKDLYRALLINIKLLEPCKHPKEKVTVMKGGVEGGLIWPPTSKKELLAAYLYYQCECGVKVQPIEFKEI